MEHQQSAAPAGGRGGFAYAQRVLMATAVVAAVLILLALIWYASDLLLLLFAAVLVSIPLRRLQGALRRHSRLGRGAALAIVTITLIAAALAFVAISAGRIASHATEFVAQVQSAFEAVRMRVSGSPWLNDALSRLPDVTELLFGSGRALSRLTGVASTTFGALINAAIVAVLAIYVASQPELYSNGIKHLVPMHFRTRTGEVLAALDSALGRWLIGRLLLMVINGGLTTVALWLLGVPLALTLGVIAGLLNFIPNFGPFIAAVPAVLIAFVQSPTLALYTALVYLAVQMVDGYVLTPLVDRRSVELPPVLTISAQLLLGLMFGFVGLLVASPLTATLMILVKMLYVEDVLGDPVMSSSEAPKRGPTSATPRAFGA